METWRIRQGCFLISPLLAYLSTSLSPSSAQRSSAGLLHSLRPWMMWEPQNLHETDHDTPQPQLHVLSNGIYYLFYLYKLQQSPHSYELVWG